jgi:hypothetical protein
VPGIDLPAIHTEILAQMRSGMRSSGTLAQALAALDHGIARHYLADLPCC